MANKTQLIQAIINPTVKINIIKYMEIIFKQKVI